MINKIMIDVAVIGGGPAGLAAALTAYKEGVSVIILERENVLGGRINQSIHSGFGKKYFKEELTGPEYASRFSGEIMDILLEEKECSVEKICTQRFMVELNSTVISINENRIITVLNSLKGIMKIEADSVIFATGCYEHNSPDVFASRPSGIYTAGTVQHLINYEGKLPAKKAVISGNNKLGLVIARRLICEGAKIEAITGIKAPDAGYNDILQFLIDNNVPIYYNTAVTKIEGTERVSSVVISETDSGNIPVRGTEKKIDCDALITAEDFISENELALSIGVETDKQTGKILVNQYNETSIQGVYLCGNALYLHDTADDITFSGITAGQAAAKYIKYSHNKVIDNNILLSDNVKFIVPQKLSASNNDARIFFEVKETLENAVCTLEYNGEIINKINKRIIVQGSIESVIINLKDINGDVILKVTGTPIVNKVIQKNLSINEKIYVTTLVRVKGGEKNVISVKTDKPVQKSEIPIVLEIAKQIIISAPVHPQDIILKNITREANLIATIGCNLSHLE